MIMKKYQKIILIVLDVIILITIIVMLFIHIFNNEQVNSADLKIEENTTMITTGADGVTKKNIKKKS
jgi:branched-subunit amino acid transport protein AzlD